MDDLEERIFGSLPDKTWVYPTPRNILSGLPE
jgi:hypothetical protein